MGFGATHSVAEHPSEVSVERIDPDGLDRQQGLVVDIELAAAGGLSEAEPVGRLVSGAAKALLLEPLAKLPRCELLRRSIRSPGAIFVASEACPAERLT